MPERTINDDTDPFAATLFAVADGTFRLRETAYGWQVLDNADQVIGSASDIPYGASGFSVHTRPFAGFVPRRNVEFV